MMRSMTTFKKWEIVLVPFPFTNQKKSKKRPAVVLSPTEYNLGEDIVIGFVTSKIDGEDSFLDYLIKNWEEASLPKPSKIKMKFATIEKKIVVKKLGKLSDLDKKLLSYKLVSFFADK